MKEKEKNVEITDENLENVSGGVELIRIGKEPTHVAAYEKLGYILLKENKTGEYFYVN